MKTLLALLLSLTAFLSVARANDRDYDDRYDKRRGGRVILFQHANYEGGALVLYPGETFDNFSGKTFDNGAKLNDGVSSIRVEGNAELFVYTDARFRGDALRLTENVRDLTTRYVKGSVGATWNDRISSAKVEGERGGGYGGGHNPKPRPPHADPEKAINSAFQDLLGRAPSASELRDFRGRFIDNGWDERMLRDFLRTDSHYRSDMANYIIRQAYLEVLGREPDRGGLESYRKKVLNSNWTETDVKDDLRKSAEYRNKHR
jgi:hypothetical protein